MLIRARSRLTRLRPPQVATAVGKGALIVDIRPEYQRRADGEVPGAIVVERNHLEWRLHPASSARIPEATDANVRWIIMCDEGFASSLAAATLREMGLTRATDIVGGFQRWREAGLPVVKRATPTRPRLVSGDNRLAHRRTVLPRSS